MGGLCWPDFTQDLEEGFGARLSTGPDTAADVSQGDGTTSGSAPVHEMPNDILPEDIVAWVGAIRGSA
jgi:hypothetical protein